MLWIQLKIIGTYRKGRKQLILNPEVYALPAITSGAIGWVQRR